MKKIISYINLPVSIIIIGVIIAGGVLLSNYTPKSELSMQEDKVINIQPINSDDNIYGNPNAKVIVIEYSDFECPYCQVFHATMNRVMEEYAKTGQVAWVYRHLPIVDVHKNSYQASMASECVKNIAEESDQNGTSAFWAFSNAVFAEVPESLSLENLRIIATDVGIDPSEFETCVRAERHADKIERDIEDAQKIAEFSADFGTPYMIVTSRSGTQAHIVGAESYENMIGIIEALLAE
jgi:protein-disulfide isomerase